MWLRKLKPRFGLRTLLVLVTGVAILLGWGTHFVRKVRRTNEIVARLEARDDADVTFGEYSFCGVALDEYSIPEWASNLGGKAAFTNVIALELHGFDEDEMNSADFAEIGELSGLESVAFGSENLPENAIPVLAKLTRLRSLRLSAVRDERLRGLAGLPDLEVLTLFGHDGSVTDKALEGAAAIRSLETVELWSCDAVSNNGLACFLSLPRLRSLMLNGCTDIDEHGLQQLTSAAALDDLTLSEMTLDASALLAISKLSRLAHLRLDSSQLDEKGLASLHLMPQLRTLDLSKTNVTNQSVEFIANCTGLTALDLGETQVTSDSLKWLKGMRRLAHLTVDNDFDENDLIALSRDLPNCWMKHGSWQQVSYYRDGQQLKSGNSIECYIPE